MICEVQTGKAKCLSSKNIQHSSAQAWILDLQYLKPHYGIMFQQQNHLGSNEQHRNYINGLEEYPSTWGLIASTWQSILGRRIEWVENVNRGIGKP